MKKFFLSVAVIFMCAAIFQSFSVDKVSAACYDGCDCGDYNFNETNKPKVTNVSNGNYQSFAVEVLNLVNAERAKVGAAPLILADDLQQAAAIRAREIIQDFSHTRPDGSDCFTVMRNRGRTCGENIAVGHASASETVEQWMDSDGHRENILNPAFRELGVGYAYEDYSTYHHYWVQLFRG